MIIIVINKGLDADGGCFTVVGDLLMGNLDIIEIFESLAGFTQRESQIYMHGQTERHDMRIMLTEL